MSNTIASLSKGEKGIIISFSEKDVPLKLMEMGCIEGNQVEVLQRAPMEDPIYLNIGGTYLAIRIEVASKIMIEKI